MELLLLFFEFLKIGFFTIGGGYAMIPLLKETVLKYGWLRRNSILQFYWYL
ncbi:MAG: chromate transporter [Christensenellales bacterium]